MVFRSKFDEIFERIERAARTEEDCWKEHGYERHGQHITTRQVHTQQHQANDATVERLTSPDPQPRQVWDDGVMYETYGLDQILLEHHGVNDHDCG